VQLDKIDSIFRINTELAISMNQEIRRNLKYELAVFNFNLY